MGQKWSAFSNVSPIQAGDVLVGLRAGVNVALDATGFMLDANNLSDVASAVTAFNNVSPLTTKGDIIVHNGTNNIRLAVGANNEILIANSAEASGLEWIANPGLLIANNLSDVASDVAAFDNISPVTTLGDMIYRDASNNVRLAIGSAGQIMAVSGGIPAWIANPAALKAANLSDVASAVTSFNNISPVTTLGDMIYRDASNNVRLAIGSAGQIMAVSGGIPAWIANPAALKASNLSDLANAATAATNLGLGVTNDVTFNSVEVGRENAIVAFAGGGQGSATQLTKQISRVVTVGSAGDSVKLPAALAGNQMVVINAAAANAMDVFPASGEYINALAVDLAISVAANKTIAFYCAVDGIWNSILTA